MSDKPTTLSPDQLAAIRVEHTPLYIRANPNKTFLTINALLDHIDALQAPLGISQGRCSPDPKAA